MHSANNDPIRRFSARHLIHGGVREFDEKSAPYWLTGNAAVPGSTVDSRWFWKDHVLSLEVGESIMTDFNEITRIE